MARTLKTRSELKAKTLKKPEAEWDSYLKVQQTKMSEISDLMELLLLHFIRIYRQISVSVECFSYIS